MNEDPYGPIPNHAKLRLESGNLVLCMGVRLGRTADIARIARAAGFDALFVDMEHSPITTEGASTNVTATIKLGSGGRLVDGVYKQYRGNCHFDRNTYFVDDVLHYCVTNMPGGVPRTSTLALNEATLPFLAKLADKGYEKALKEDKNFLTGLNIFKGCITHRAVADVFGQKYVSPQDVLGKV